MGLHRAARRRAVVVTAVVAAVVALDQLTKTWALRALDDGPIHVVWTLDLRLTFNTGGAFGLGSGAAPLFVIGAVVVLFALIRLGRHPSGGWPTGHGGMVALGLVAGGAVGNLADRLVRDTGGAVIDFIDLGWWPVFNVADAAIVCGAGLLVLTARR